MYKVFFNQKPLYLTTTLQKQTTEFPLFFVKYTSKEFIIKALKSKKCKGIYLYHAKEDKLWQHFLRFFPVVVAAGGFVQHKDEKRYLFIYRNDKWDLPKGRVEKKENIQKAAIREVEEETAVQNVEISGILPTTFHIFKRNNVYKLKKTFWYAMRTDFEGTLEPQTEEGIEKAVWKEEKDFEHLFENAYENIKEVVRYSPS